MPENEVKQIYELFKNEYITKGYMYSGMIPMNAPPLQAFPISMLYSMVEDGILQKRNCDGFAFELSPAERIRLLTECSLCSAWFEETGTAFLHEIQQEARSAAALPVTENGITVATMRHEGDTDVPDKMTVQTPFSVGQVINMEYDLPKNPSWAAYNHYQDGHAGVRVGQFIVTDILHNMLVYPRMNMIAVQSLDADFNKLYPNDRSMLLFEDVVLKRMKDKLPSLDAQIQGAQERSASGKAAEVLEYDSALAQRCSEVSGVDVLSPQEAADLFGKPVKEGSKVFTPRANLGDTGR